MRASKTGERKRCVAPMASAGAPFGAGGAHQAERAQSRALVAVVHAVRLAAAPKHAGKVFIRFVRCDC